MDFQTIILSEDKKDKICDFRVNFSKPLIFQEESEVGLLEITVPDSIKTNPFALERKLTLNLIWIKHWFKNQDYEDKTFLKTYQTDRNFDESCLIKEYISTPQQFFTVDDFKKWFRNELSNVIDQKIKIMFKKRFDKYDFQQGIPETETDVKIILPELISNNNIFENKPGWISVKNAELPNEPMNPIAYLFINFDPELHSMLGFDSNDFPIFQPIEFQDKFSTPIEEKKAKFEVKEFGKFDNIFVYSDIVGETYVGNIKANILRIFARNYSYCTNVTYAFYNIIFIPLRIKEINSIRIQICDSFGQIASYDRGHINLVLIIKSSKQN